uniref:Uncharacterized protein n=1 Tax=Magallana gigas TaxID=29159 RepID=K1PRH9_MAGGI
MCALLPTLGLTWVFGVLSLGGAAVVFQYLFAIFNSLQVSKSSSKEMQSFEESNEGFRNESTGFAIPRIDSSGIGQHGPFKSS